MSPALRLFMASGMLGIPYISVTLLAYGVFGFAAKAFRPRLVDVLALVPIAVYLAMLLKENRQEANAGAANLLISATVVLSLLLRAKAFPSRPILQALLAPALGTVAALLAWRTIPCDPFMRFEGW